MARRKKEAPSVHRANIARAAQMLFERQGVEKTTVDEIAEVASYGKATLYVYFANKDEIFFYVVHQHMLELLTKLKDIIKAEISTAARWYKIYLEICFAIHDSCKDSSMYFDAMIDEIDVAVDDPDLPLTYREIYATGEELEKVAAIMMDRGIELGLIKGSLSYSETAMYFWGAITGIVRMYERKSSYYNQIGLAESSLSRAFFGLVNGYLAESEAEHA